VFKAETLLKILKAGTRMISAQYHPKMLDSYRVYAYLYGQKNLIQDYITVTLEDGEREPRLETRVRDSSYWRDVGTLDAYWNANMDLTGVDPYFNLYGVKWPIHTNQVWRHRPNSFSAWNGRRDCAWAKPRLPGRSGCIVSGIVRNSVLSYNVWSEAGPWSMNP